MFEHKQEMVNPNRLESPMTRLLNRIQGADEKGER